MRFSIGDHGYATGLVACLAIGGMLLAGCGAGSDSDATAGGGGAADSELNWLTSYEDAMVQSSETNKPVLAFFTGSDW